MWATFPTQGYDGKNILIHWWEDAFILVVDRNKYLISQREQDIELII